MEFVDTNILLSAYVATGERHEAASALVDRLWRECRGAISVQVLQEFYVNATRKVEKPIDPEIAVDMLKSLVRWRVHSPLPDDVIAAATLSSPAVLLGRHDRPQCRRIALRHFVDGGPERRPGCRGIQLSNPFMRGSAS